MKIGIYSDLHREYAKAPRTVETGGVDVLVLAGDIDNGIEGVCWAKTLDIPVVYVAGNHEYWGHDYFEVLDALRNEAAGSNVHFLERDTVVLEGVRFLGCTLWTDYGGWHEGLVPYALDMNDHREITARSWWSQENRERYHRQVPSTYQVAEHDGGFNPVLQYEICELSVQWLKSTLAEPFEGRTVVVTHDAPSFESLRLRGVHPMAFDPRYWTPHGIRGLRLDLVANYAVNLDAALSEHREVIDLWVHGHIHETLDYARRGVRIIDHAQPLRYRDPSPLAPKVVDLNHDSLVPLVLPTAQDILSRYPPLIDEVRRYESVIDAAEAGDLLAFFVERQCKLFDQVTWELLAYLCDSLQKLVPEPDPGIPTLARRLGVQFGYDGGPARLAAFENYQHIRDRRDASLARSAKEKAAFDEEGLFDDGGYSASIYVEKHLRHMLAVQKFLENRLESIIQKNAVGIRKRCAGLSSVMTGPVSMH